MSVRPGDSIAEWSGGALEARPSDGMGTVPGLKFQNISATLATEGVSVKQPDTGNLGIGERLKINLNTAAVEKAGSLSQTPAPAVQEPQPALAVKPFEMP